MSQDIPHQLETKDQGRPDTATLYNELVSVSDWHTLGLYLGVKDHELDQIERSHPIEGCGRWKQETFSLWLKRTPNASWRDVVGALRRMGENTEAEKIERKYTVGSVCTNAVTPFSTTPESLFVASAQNPAAVAWAQRNIQMIKTKFSSVVTKSCTKLQSRKISVEKVQTFLVTMYSSPNSSNGSYMVATVVEPARSLDEIFRALSKHGLWNYLNYYLLQSIIEEFACDDDELKGMMEQYQRDLTGYALAVKIQTHFEAVVTAIDSENSTDENVLVSSPQHKHKLFKKLSVKVKANITDHSLEYVNNLWRSLAIQFSLPQPAMILHKVAEGSIGITWLIPANLVEYVTRMAQKTSNVFAEKHILRVMLEEQCVYPMEAEPPPLKTLPEAEALSMVPQVYRKRKWEDDLETDQPAPKRHIIASKTSDSEEDGENHSSGHATPLSEDIPPEIPVYKHGYECEIIDPPAWAKALPTTCPICLQVLRNPRQTECGHIFCEVCIEQFQASHKQTCPECKQTPISISPHESLRRLLNDLQVQCTGQNEEGVCDWTGKLRELDDHLNLNPTEPDQLLTGCKFVSLQCEFSYAGCEAEMFRKDMTIHMEEKQSYHIQLLAEKVKKQDRQLKEQIQEQDRQRQKHSKQIEKLTTKLQRKEEETACTIQQMQKEFTLQLQSKDEEIAHLMQQKRSTPHVHPVNFCFTVDKFKYHMESEKEWVSEPFYTHPQGYKMCVEVFISGLDISKKYLSLYTCVMKGENDDKLSWPFYGKLTVQLLNQKSDEHHHVYTIHYDESIPQHYCERVLIGERNRGWGNHRFISHSKISQEDSQVQYVKDDCIKFRISDVLLYD